MIAASDDWTIAARTRVALSSSLRVRAPVGLAGLATRPLDLLLTRCRLFDGCSDPVLRTAAPAPSPRRGFGFCFPVVEAEAGGVPLFGAVRRRLVLLSLFIMPTRPCS